MKPTSLFWFPKVYDDFGHTKLKEDIFHVSLIYSRYILAAFRMTVWTWDFWMEQRVRNQHHLLLWMYEPSHCRWTFSQKHNLLYFMLYECNLQFRLQVYHYSSHALADAPHVAFQPCKLEILIDTCILLGGRSWSVVGWLASFMFLPKFRLGWFGCGDQDQVRRWW